MWNRDFTGNLERRLRHGSMVKMDGCRQGERVDLIVKKAIPEREINNMRMMRSLRDIF